MKDGVTAEGLSAYNKAVSGHQRLEAFQAGIRDIVRNPLTVEGVTVGFQTEADIHSFIDLARQVTTDPTPQQIAILHFLPKLMAMAKESATRQYERTIQQPRQQGNQAPGDRPVVTPKPTEQPANQSTTDPFGRVSSSREMLRQQDPQLFNEVMQGKKKLFGG